MQKHNGQKMMRSTVSSSVSFGHSFYCFVYLSYLIRIVDLHYLHNIQVNNELPYDSADTLYLDLLLNMVIDYLFHVYA